MRNGIHSSKTHSSKPDADDDAAMYYPYQINNDLDNDSVVPDPSGQAKATFAVFLAVSIACMAAAVATGSYAAWLSRQQAARQALTDVSDILKSCQSRMQQLEAQVERLPGRGL